MTYPSSITLVLLTSVGAWSVAHAADPLTTVSARYATTTDYYVADARIEAVQQATVAAETTGRIKEILFDVDDLVGAGEVLLRFTDNEQRAQLARAEAAQREAEARLGEAEEEHTRITRVYAQKLVAKSAMDKAEADLKAAQQRLAAARAGVEEARQQLEYTVVRAPYAGIVVERHVSVGERVGPGTPLMTGFSLVKLRATADVPQSRVEAIRRHSRARLTLDSIAAEIPVEGKAITIYPYANPGSHSFTVRLALESVPEGFYPGMFAKAAFEIGTRTRLMIPATAVVHRSEVTAVYVVTADQRIQFRTVRLGQRLPDEAGEHIEILAGLEEGESVALDPVAAGAQLKAQRVTEAPAT